VTESTNFSDVKVCLHLFSRIFCELRTSWTQRPDGSRKETYHPCKEHMGQECPFGKGEG